jgi:hypothetical protein
MLSMFVIEWREKATRGDKPSSDRSKTGERG